MSFVITINWSELVGGLLLLFFPADFLLSKTVQLRSFESFTSLDNSPSAHSWWHVPLLFIDPFRGYGGAWLVMHGVGCLGFSRHFFHFPAQWIPAGALILAAVIQTYTRRDTDVMLAPMGFLAGVLALLVAPAVAAISLILALAAVFGLRSFFAFFCVAAILVPVIGIPFKADIICVAICSALFGLPMLLSVILGRTLELPTARDPNKAKLSPLRS